MSSKITNWQAKHPQLAVRGRLWNLIRVPGFGRYRKPTEGIRRLGKFRMTNFRFRMEPNALQFERLRSVVALLDGVELVG